MNVIYSDILGQPKQKKSNVNTNGRTQTQVSRLLDFVLKFTLQNMQSLSFIRYLFSAVNHNEFTAHSNLKGHTKVIQSVPEKSDTIEINLLL